MQYWILKTEPGAYSFSDLQRDKVTTWDGVRNYQARNNLKSMHVGDLALIYHSVSSRELVGIAETISTAFKDETAKDGDWVAVKIQYIEQLRNPVSLQQIKADKRLSRLSLVKQGRLSVSPVTVEEWKILMELANKL